MTKLNRVILISVAALLGAAVTTSAMAAPEPICRNYAQLAVSQYGSMQNLNLGCQGFRWHAWYDGHYLWCRDVSKESAQSEIFARKRTLFSGQC